MNDRGWEEVERRLNGAGCGGGFWRGAEARKRSLPSERRPAYLLPVLGSVIVHKSHITWPCLIEISRWALRFIYYATHCTTMSREIDDTNFCFPVPETLQSERVKLTPFIVEQHAFLADQWNNHLHQWQPSKHADAFFASSTTSLYDHLPFGPFETVEDFLSVLVENRNPACVLFAVYDKTRPSASPASGDEGAFAGTIGLQNTSTTNLSTEIGFILILPPFQRTHVTSNAIGLLLQYTLNRPSEGGLGLRRVAWKASPNNLPSIKAAERLGFKREGVTRWAFVLSEGKRNGNGFERRKGDPRENCLGRDTVDLSICWDEWEDGRRMHVDVVMARKSWGQVSSHWWQSNGNQPCWGHNDFSYKPDGIWNGCAS